MDMVRTAVMDMDRNDFVGGIVLIVLGTILAVGVALTVRMAFQVGFVEGAMEAEGAMRRMEIMRAAETKTVDAVAEKAV
jgi:hypothetical protein